MYPLPVVVTVARLSEDDWRSRMLVAAVAAWSRSGNAVRVGLWVPDDNARARRFYEREGFRMTGQRRSFLAIRIATSARCRLRW